MAQCFMSPLWPISHPIALLSAKYQEELKSIQTPSIDHKTHSLLTPVLGLVNPVANTIVRTTFAFTMMKGSDASNVIPTTSTAVVNTRINVGETCDDVQKHIQTRKVQFRAMRNHHEMTDLSQ